MKLGSETLRRNLWNATFYAGVVIVAVLLVREGFRLGWPLFAQLAVNGLTLGSVYALIALGYSMVYGILKLLNFAHGDVYMVGAFIGYAILTLFGNPTAATWSVPVWALVTLMFVASMLGCGLLGVVIERFAYRPLREAPRIAPLISALGVSFFLQNSALLLLGSQFRSYPFGLIGQGGVQISTVFVSATRLFVIVGAIVLMVLLTLFVGRSRLGKAIRATSYDREAAMMMGIDADRVIAATFFIGSALAGAAGVMFGLVFSQIFHFMGFVAGLKGFTAAVVGGIGSIPGAMLGGLLIGLGEAYATGYVSSTYQDLIVFCILIFVILVRPSGLLGTAAVQKV
jgi:branched-chain amino acid transport system permease protein